MTIRMRALYPLLASIYPVLGLAAINAGEWIHPGALVTPLLISVIAAAFFFLAAGALTRDPHRRALITFVLVVVFAGYGPLTTFLAHRPGLVTFSRDSAALPLVVILAIGAILGLVSSHRSFAGVSLFLSIMTCLLVLFAATSLAAARFRGRRVEASSITHGLPGAPPGDTAGRRDIYLIVLDKYTGVGSLRRNYGFDNSPFVRYLRSRGFFVPMATRANYVHTPVSLASFLNWEYLDELARTMGPESRDWGPAYHRIEHNRTVALLKQLGYDFVFFPTAFRATSRNAEADLQIPDPRQITPEFETAWLRTTLLGPFLELTCRLRECTAYPGVPEPTTLIDWKFEQLAQLRSIDRPRFIFAHLMVPHEPYVYRRDCSPRAPYWPQNDFGPDSAEIRAAYVEQIQCVNAKLATLIERLLQSPRRPVILLQSDHGHGRLGWNPPPIETATPEQIAERPDIFAAYYVPGAPKSLFYDSITPVNVLPTVFHHLFRTPLRTLPDQTYWSSLAEPYRFTRIP